MDAGIGGAFRILKSSIEGVAIAIGESLDLSVTKMMNAISRALSGLIEWIGKNQEVVKKVALIVAGVVAVGAAFIGIGSAAAVAAFAVGGQSITFREVCLENRDYALAIKREFRSWARARRSGISSYRVIRR